MSVIRQRDLPNGRHNSRGSIYHRLLDGARTVRRLILVRLRCGKHVPSNELYGLITPSLAINLGRRKRSRGSRSNNVVVLRTPSERLLAKSNIPTTGFVARLLSAGH